MGHPISPKPAAELRLLVRGILAAVFISRSVRTDLDEVADYAVSLENKLNRGLDDADPA